MCGSCILHIVQTQQPCCATAERVEDSAGYLELDDFEHHIEKLSGEMGGNQLQIFNGILLKVAAVTIEPEEPGGGAVARASSGGIIGT